MRERERDEPREMIKIEREKDEHSKRQKETLSG